MKKEKYLLAIIMIGFGSIGLFVKSVPFTSGQIALARGAIGSLFIFLYTLISKQKLSWSRIRPNLKLLILLGTLIGINWILLFQAYHYTTIPNATVLYYLAPVIMVILANRFLNEKLTTVRIISILAALMGMVCIVGIDLSAVSASDLTGFSFALGAAVLYATVITLNKFLKNISGIESTFVQLLFAAISLFPYVMMTDGFSLTGISSTAIGLILFVGIFHTGISYTIYFTVVRKISNQTVAAYSYIDPVSAILMSTLFFHESMTPLQILGGVLILGATMVSELFGNNLKSTLS